MGHNKFLIIIVTLLAILFFLPVLAQKPAETPSSSVSEIRTFPISGQVIDSLSRKPMTYVNVTLRSGRDAMLTDRKGRFAFSEVTPGDSVCITSLGYEPKVLPVSLFSSDKRVKVLMTNNSVQLQEVVVTKKKKAKYSKKNNPAVELMERIRREYPLHDPRRSSRYSYSQYDKMVISLNDFKIEKSPWLAKQLHPISDFIDTAHITGKPVLNVSVREKYSTDLNTANPGRHKSVVRGIRSVGIDDAFNQENIQIMLDDVLREVSIFGNDITLMQNRFVSPLSRIGADYYKYFLGDTVKDERGHRIAELIFVPHNPESFSFNGSIYVDIDSPEAFIPKVTMRIPKALNLNFVNNIFIEQEFEMDDKGNRHKTSEDMSVELQILPGVQGFYVNKNSVYSGFSYEDSEDFASFMSYPEETINILGNDAHPMEYWYAVRPEGIAASQSKVDELSKRMDKSPVFYWVRRGLRVLVEGYIPTGKPSKFDIGPVNTFFSVNTIEGIRLRAGGMTTAALSPHLFARGFVARGFKDHKWKYHGELEYSFRRKKKHSYEFPMHSVRLESTYDLDFIGQHYLFTNTDNIFLSLKRKENVLATYRLSNKLSYIYEHVSGLTLQAGIKSERQQPTRWLPFTDGYGNVLNHFWQSAFFIDLQFAPGATFVQTASHRLPVNMDTWIFRLSHEYGPKGFLGADFTTNKTEFSVQKRFWFSSFGYLDAMAKGGKMWSSVYYPALTWPNANLSYTIQPESYALMNPMEFAMDTYAEWNLTYWMNGLIFNRIPVINALKLREVVSFNGLWGHLSKRNNPEHNPWLLRFPEDSNARALSGTPYMEISAGIDNILSVLRLDYVWRLSYRNTPGAPNSGLRVSFHMSF